jgi:hypothetical protein
LFYFQQVDIDFRQLNPKVNLESLLSGWQDFMAKSAAYCKQNLKNSESLQLEGQLKDCQTEGKFIRRKH